MRCAAFYRYVNYAQPAVFLYHCFIRINIMKAIYSILLCVTTSAHSWAQDTFSIVGLDSLTREVGGAGASCVDLNMAGFSDASFISQLFPDTGAINTQASYLPANQDNARARMRAGNSPAQIINWLQTNDIAGDASIRQYGVVGFSGQQPSVAAHTGTNALNYKNHITGHINGFYYSIQGNILLGPQVLSNMENNFRNTQGDLACRLMAALQGANMVGADTRCSANNTSSLFSFLKVSKPTDAYGNPSLSLGVITADGDKKEPIDSLQKLFNQARSCHATSMNALNDKPDLVWAVYPNPATNQLLIRTESQAELPLTIIDMLGRNVLSSVCFGPTSLVDISILEDGLYFIQLGNRLPKTFVKCKS